MTQVCTRWGSRGVAAIGLAAVAVATPGSAEARLWGDHATAALLPLTAAVAIGAADPGAVAQFHLTDPLNVIPPRSPQKPTALIGPAETVASPIAPVPRLAATPPPGMSPGVAFAGMSLPPLLVDPVLTYQPRRRGPVVEVGVIGGGMSAAADLAHVGMHWRF